MEDWQKQKLDRLEKFQRTVSAIVDGLDTAIKWILFLLTVGITALIYFKPLEATGTTQAIVFALCLSVFSFIGYGWTKVALIRDRD